MVHLLHDQHVAAAHPHAVIKMRQQLSISQHIQLLMHGFLFEWFLLNKTAPPFSRTCSVIKLKRWSKLVFNSLKSSIITSCGSNVKALEEHPNGYGRPCTKKQYEKPINQSINQPINRSINQSINQSVNQSINRSIGQSIERSINQSIERPLTWCTIKMEEFARTSGDSTWYPRRAQICSTVYSNALICHCKTPI